MKIFRNIVRWLSLKRDRRELERCIKEVSQDEIDRMIFRDIKRFVELGRVARIVEEQEGYPDEHF